MRCNKPRELSLDRHGRLTHCTNGAYRMNNAIECSESETFSSVAQKNSPKPTIRGTFCRQTSGIWVMAISSVTNFWFFSIYKCSMQLTFKLEQNGIHRNISHLLRSRPGRSSLEKKISDVRVLASVYTAVHGNVTLGVAVGPRQKIADHLLAKADVIRSMHERVQLCQDLQTDDLLRVHGHTILQEREAAKVLDEVRQRSLERPLPGFTEDRSEHATLSASQSSIGYRRAWDVGRPSIPRRSCSPNHDFWTGFGFATTARLLPKQPLLARLDAVIELATAAFSTLLMIQRNPPLGCILQKAPQQQTNRGSRQYNRHNGPTITNPTVPEMEQSGSASQDDDDDSEPTFAPGKVVSMHHSSRRGSPGCLTEPDCDD